MKTTNKKLTRLWWSNVLLYSTIGDVVQEISVSIILYFSRGFAMLTKRRNIYLLFVLMSTALFSSNLAYGQSSTRNIIVLVNKQELIHWSWVVDTSFDKKKVKCKVYRPPDMILTKKPEFGKVIFKKGVVIDNNKLSDDNKKYCKDKIIKATTAEYISDKKGKTTFKIQVLYRQGRYEEHIFQNILFNVNVR